MERTWGEERAKNERRTDLELGVMCRVVVVHKGTSIKNVYFSLFQYCMPPICLGQLGQLGQFFNFFDAPSYWDNGA